MGVGTTEHDRGAAAAVDRQPLAPVRTDPSARIARAAIENRDDPFFLERARVFSVLALLFFGGFAIFDAIACRVGGQGDLVPVLALRALGFVLVLHGHFFFRREPSPSLVRTRWHASLQMLVMAASIAAMTWFTGGYGSVYHAGTMIIGFALLFFPMPWEKAFRLAYAIVFVHILVGIVLPLASESIRALGADTTERVTVTLYVLYIGAALTLAAVVASTVWSMRREVFEAKSIGRYKIRRLLARGGMGEIWAAYDATLRREVALKILVPKDERPYEAVVRFEREVQSMTKLSHPHTVRVYDYGATGDGMLYYAMELLEGEHLGELVAREGPLSCERAARIVLQTARALAEAHALGIVHRDVKPENIFLQRTGDGHDFVKVLDFGIAKSVGLVDATAVTRTGSVAGTPSTVSPEVIQGEEASPASDVYGLGAVLYYLLTGVLPFANESMMATVLAHLTVTPVRPSLRRGAPIPASLEALVLRCLAKTPYERAADARQLAEALEIVLPELDDGAVPDRPSGIFGREPDPTGPTRSLQSRTRRAGEA